MTATGRSYDRSPEQLRPTTIEPGFVRTATGSALISMGETRVICTASAQQSVPRWLTGSGRGWVTAEYGMLPASTGERKQRDASRGRPDGRTVEIQRLIGRALRAVVSLERLGERTVIDHFYDFLEKRGARIPTDLKNRDLTQPNGPNEQVQKEILKLYKSSPEVSILFELMTDFDEGLQEWRYRHIKLVERTIGAKKGTGGSPGVPFLKESLFRPVFHDLWAIRHEL